MKKPDLIWRGHLYPNNIPFPQSERALLSMTLRQLRQADREHECEFISLHLLINITLLKCIATYLNKVLKQ